MNIVLIGMSGAGKSTLDVPRVIHESLRMKHR